MQLIPEFNGPELSASGGVCYFCGSGRQPSDKGIVLTDINIHMEGIIEVCRNCVVQMSALYGCLSPEAADDLRARNREFGRRAGVAEKRLAKNDIISGLITELQEEATA